MDLKHIILVVTYVGGMGCPTQFNPVTVVLAALKRASGIMTYSINVYQIFHWLKPSQLLIRIGTVAAVGATTAVIVHGAATLTRNKILDMKEEKRLKEEGLWDEKKHNNGGGH